MAHYFAGVGKRRSDGLSCTGCRGSVALADGYVNTNSVTMHNEE